MKTFDARDMLLKLPLNFAAFPSLAEIESFSASFVKKRQPPKQLEEIPAWISTQAPGTPAAVEALFLYIEKQNFNRGFEYGLKQLRINENDILEWHQSWKKGLIHQNLQFRAQEINKNGSLTYSKKQ